MGGELEELILRAEQLGRLGSGHPEADRARRLAERLAVGRFVVTVVGEFNRGKSTLVNALLGEEILPSGVLPLTAVATYVGFGEPGVSVEALDGTRRPVGRDEIADYVSERLNPGNERGVSRVEVQGLWPLLESGVVLVDTPGLGSLHHHNTEAGREALLDGDGAVVVMSADAPFSGQERDLLVMLAERRSPTFFVLNRADHLSRSELSEVQRFVESVMRETLGHDAPIYAVSSKAAVDARAAGLPGYGDSLDFQKFADELERFVEKDLVAARLATARAELGRLGASLRDSLSVEESAREMEVAGLTRLVAQLEGEADRQRAALEDDLVLLSRRAAALSAEAGESLTRLARLGSIAGARRLEEVAAGSPRATLVDALRGAMEEAVRASLEQSRLMEVDRVDRAWQALAESARARTEERVAAVRSAASELFSVPLPRVRVPPFADQQEHFSYSFVQVGSFGRPLGLLVSRLLPLRTARRSALSRSRAELSGELDKHAGRARSDLARRLGEARRSLESDMREELERSIEAIVQATHRAGEWRRKGESERRVRAAEEGQLRSLACGLASLDEPA